MAKKKRNNVNYIVVTLMLSALIFIGLGVIILLTTVNEKILTPDYAPGTIDTHAIKEDNNSEKMELSDNGGGAVSLSYSNVAAVDLKEKKIKMYFKNPGKSREDIVLYIAIVQNDEEVVIAQSDLIPAGYAIYSLDLNEDIQLQKGGYDGIFRITYYNEDTGAKEIVDTVIKISIEVS